MNPGAKKDCPNQNKDGLPVVERSKSSDAAS